MLNKIPGFIDYFGQGVLIHSLLDIRGFPSSRVMESTSGRTTGS